MKSTHKNEEEIILKKVLTYAFIGLILIAGIGVYVADIGGADLANDPRGGIIILDK